MTEYQTCKQTEPEFVSGVDLTFNNPTLMDIQSCMAARYDAGVVKHQKEHTGAIEIWKIESVNG